MHAETQVSRTLRVWAGLALAGVCVWAVAPGAEASPPPARPNFLFIHTDDVDYSEIGAYEGKGAVWTPHIDSLIRGGLKFNRGYVVTGVCVPSRFSTHTGRFSSRNAWLAREVPADRPLNLENENNHRKHAPVIEEGEVTLAHLLRAHGYATGLFGKYHNERTAHIYTEVIEGDARDPAVAAKVRARYEAMVARVRIKSGYETVDRLYYENIEQLCIPAELRAINSPWITEGALRFMEANKDRPFLLYYSSPIPHGGALNPQSSGKMVGSASKYFEGSPLATPAGFLEKIPDVQPSREDALRRVQEQVPQYAPSTALYTVLDDSVGALLQKLRDLGLEENTVIVFLSDHQSRDKFSIYEGTVRVPFAVYWKGHIEAGLTSDALAASIDLVPTFCELAAIPRPAGVHWDGLSLVPLFDDPGYPLRDALFLEFGFSRGVVTRRWKYLAYRFPEGMEPITSANRVIHTGGQRPGKTGLLQRHPAMADFDQLYDLEADPGETRNLFQDPACREVAAEMQARMRETLEGFPHAYFDLRPAARPGSGR